MRRSEKKKRPAERVPWSKRRTPTAKSAHISRRIHLVPQDNKNSNESVTGAQTNKSALYRIASVAFSFVLLSTSSDAWL